jgi:uncharacterized membrane protein YcaP (DUF421 family)
MDLVLRALFIYFFLLLVFSIAGKRALSEMDTFDLVLLLIVSEATQDALGGETRSVTGAIILITTLVSAEVFMSWLKHKRPQVEKTLEGGPLIVVENGKLLKDRADKEMIDESDILTSARQLKGIERLDQIKYAILEMGGEISIIPKDGAKA